MPIETLAALIFTVAYVLGVFILAMGAAVAGRFVWEVLRDA